MSLPLQLALVADGVDIDFGEVSSVAAALAKQASRDFAPLWHVNATVAAFKAVEDVPIDYWPLVIMRDVKDAAGYHEDQDGQPYAVIEFEEGWSITASHEMVEMLADPFGRRVRSGSVPDQAELPPQRVKYLVEVADPCEGAAFAYTVNGVQVSDFYTPHFFDPVRVAGVRYSFTGAIDGPRKVLKDGYISWQDPATRDWMQLRMFADEFSTSVPHVVNLTKEHGVGRAAGENLRSAIDRATTTPRSRAARKRGAKHEAVLAAAGGDPGGLRDSQAARADGLRIAIQKLR